MVFISFLLAALLLMGALSPKVDAEPAALPALYIIGDSTVSNHEPGLLGWGDPIKSYFNPAQIHVVNKARGGRSSRSFQGEGLWKQVLAELKPGDYVLIDFGINDGGPITNPNGRASLKGIGGESETVSYPETGKTETVHTYGWYMRTYVTEAKAKGATAVLISPIARCIWNSSHQVQRNNEDYGLWAKQIADSEHVPFIDLNGIVAQRFDALGEEKVKELYFPKDHTHTNATGAELNAAAVVYGLEHLPPCPLQHYLRPSAREMARTELSISPHTKGTP